MVLEAICTLIVLELCVDINLFFLWLSQLANLSATCDLETDFDVCLSLIMMWSTSNSPIITFQFHFYSAHATSHSLATPAGPSPINRWPQFGRWRVALARCGCGLATSLARHVAGIEVPYPTLKK